MKCAIEIAYRGPDSVEDICNAFASELSAYVMSDFELPDPEEDEEWEDFSERDDAAWQEAVDDVYDEALRLIQAARRDAKAAGSCAIA